MESKHIKQSQDHDLDIEITLPLSLTTFPFEQGCVR